MQRQIVELGAERSRVRISLGPPVFPLGQGNYSALLCGPVSLGVGMLIWPSPHHCSPIGRASVLWANSREMSARGYALQSVCPKLSLFPPIIHSEAAQVMLRTGSQPRASDSDVTSICQEFIPSRHIRLELRRRRRWPDDLKPRKIRELHVRTSRMATGCN